MAVGTPQEFVAGSNAMTYMCTSETPDRGVTGVVAIPLRFGKPIGQFRPCQEGTGLIAPAPMYALGALGGAVRCNAPGDGTKGGSILQVAYANGQYFATVDCIPPYNVERVCPGQAANFTRVPTWYRVPVVKCRRNGKCHELPMVQ